MESLSGPIIPEERSQNTSARDASRDPASGARDRVFSGQYRAVLLGGLLGFLAATIFCLAALESFGPGVWEASMLRRLSPIKNELTRIRTYESELQRREQALRSVLRDIQGLNFSLPGNSTPPSKREGLRGGLGGGREHTSGDVRSQRLERIEERLRKMSSRITTEGENDSLLVRLDRSIQTLSHVPFGTPVPAAISSEFGMRISPFNASTQMHTGIDFAAENRAPVFVTGDGVVTQTGWNGSYGLSVVVRHTRDIETLYAHLSSVNVRVGETTARGKMIGRVGSTGNSTGPHLHYEVRLHGRPQNPSPYMEAAKSLALRS